MAAKKSKPNPKMATIKTYVVIAGAAILLVAVGLLCYYAWLDHGQNANKNSQPASPQATQPTTTATPPSTQPTQQNATSTPPKPAQSSPPAPAQQPSIAGLTVDIVGLSAHIRSQQGYELDVLAGSNLTTQGTCTITMTKPDGATISQTQPTALNGQAGSSYPTSCYWIKLLSFLNASGQWERYVDPGTWTVTVTITGDGKEGSSSKQITF